MQAANNKAGLAIVFRNPQPQREARYPGGWILLAGDRQIQVLVCRDEARRPHVVRKEAA
jgi:hypothetical protein